MNHHLPMLCGSLLTAVSLLGCLTVCRRASQPGLSVGEEEDGDFFSFLPERSSQPVRQPMRWLTPKGEGQQNKVEQVSQLSSDSGD